MGAADAEEDERPVHRVYVSEFFIGRFPVTNDDYAKFVPATGHPPPAVRGLPLISLGGREALFRETAAPYVWESGQPPTGHGSHPVVLVRYHDALAYCDWLSATIGRLVRLPTEAEWEKAARGGSEGQRYPWGNDIDASRGNYLSRSVDAAATRHAADRHLSAERLRTLRRLRQRLGVGGRLVQPRVLRSGRDARSARTPQRQHAHRPRRIVGQRRCVDAAVRVPAQGAAGYVYLQHRVPDRMRGVKKTSEAATAEALTPEGYAKARRYLMRRDPVLGAAIKKIGACGMADRQRKDHLSALVSAIVSQQLSTKAAATIFGRFVALFPDDHIPDAAAIAAQSDAALRGVGLSGQKVSYMRDLSARLIDGRLNLDELDALPDEEVIQRLVAVKGFGRWTAEMFLMFRLHRPDVLPGGDLGIVVAIQRLYKLRKRPDAKRVLKIGEAWRPYRSVASWYLWQTLKNEPLKTKNSELKTRELANAFHCSAVQRPVSSAALRL